MRQDSNSLIHLSSNQHVQKYVQTDAEALILVAKQYAAKITANDVDGAQAVLVEHEKQQGVAAVMGDPETRRFVLTLIQLEEHMAFTDALTTKWIREHMLGRYGGVSEPRNSKTKKLM